MINNLMKKVLLFPILILSCGPSADKASYVNEDINPIGKLGSVRTVVPENLDLSLVTHWPENIGIDILPYTKYANLGLKKSLEQKKSELKKLNTVFKVKPGEFCLRIFNRFRSQDLSFKRCQNVEAGEETVFHLSAFMPVLKSYEKSLLDRDFPVVDALRLENQLDVIGFGVNVFAMTHPKTVTVAYGTALLSQDRDWRVSDDVRTSISFKSHIEQVFKFHVTHERKKPFILNVDRKKITISVEQVGGKPKYPVLGDEPILFTDVSYSGSKYIRGLREKRPIFEQGRFTILPSYWWSEQGVSVKASEATHFLFSNLDLRTGDVEKNVRLKVYNVEHFEDGDAGEFQLFVDGKSVFGYQPTRRSFYLPENGNFRAVIKAYKSDSLNKRVLLFEKIIKQ